MQLQYSFVAHAHMKLTIVLVLISFSIYSQDSTQTGDLHISGQIELQGADIISKDRLGLLTKVQSNDSTKTILFDIQDNGYFKIDALKAGRYRLTFRVNEDYRVIDTVLTMSTDNFHDIRITPIIKRPCTYEAGKDIETNNISILVVCDKGLRVNSKADHSFEKKFNVRYLILSQPIPNPNCLKRYNEIIFNHLDKEFGERWRKSVRRDSIGFK